MDKAELDVILAKHRDMMKRGSRRWKRLRARKGAILKRIDNQVRDVLHKQTTKLVSTLHKRGVQTVVIGDVRDIRQDLDYGKKANQKMHQWVAGKVRGMITYKSEALGMRVAIQDEAYTSQTCPACGERHKPTGREYRCKCGFRYHRDGVGSWNIRAKYLGSFGSPVVGAMASPIGVRYAF